MNEQRRDDYKEKTRIQESGKKIRRSVENFLIEKEILFSIKILRKINKFQIEIRVKMKGNEIIYNEVLD